MSEQIGKDFGCTYLTELSIHERARVQGIGGRDSSMARRLGMLGIRPGVEIQMMHGPGVRGAVIRVGGARVALGRQVIEHIQISRERVDVKSTMTPESSP